jgi:hypothetical protein
VLIAIITGIAGLIVLRRLLRRAPIATVGAVAIAGFGVQTGLIPIVPAIAVPIHRASASVRAWQHRQSARLVCEISQSNALQSDDPAQLAQANDACASAS